MSLADGMSSCTMDLIISAEVLRSFAINLMTFVENYDHFSNGLEEFSRGYEHLSRELEEFSRGYEDFRNGFYTKFMIAVKELSVSDSVSIIND